MEIVNLLEILRCSYFAGIVGEKKIIPVTHSRHQPSVNLSQPQPQPLSHLAPEEP
jgi:hypothetical protein